MVGSQEWPGEEKNKVISYVETHNTGSTFSNFLLNKQRLTHPPPLPRSPNSLNPIREHNTLRRLLLNTFVVCLDTACHLHPGRANVGIRGGSGHDPRVRPRIEARPPGIQTLIANMIMWMACLLDNVTKSAMLVGSYSPDPVTRLGGVSWSVEGIGIYQNRCTKQALGTSSICRKSAQTKVHAWGLYSEWPAGWCIVDNNSRISVSFLVTMSGNLLQLLHWFGRREKGSVTTAAVDYRGALTQRFIFICLSVDPPRLRFLGLRRSRHLRKTYFKQQRGASVGIVHRL